MTDFEDNILNRLAELIHQGKLSNSFMVKNIELMCDYSGLKPINKIHLWNIIFKNKQCYNFFIKVKFI